MSKEDDLPTVAAYRFCPMCGLRFTPAIYNERMKLDHVLACLSFVRQNLEEHGTETIPYMIEPRGIEETTNPPTHPRAG